MKRNFKRNFSFVKKSKKKFRFSTYNEYQTFKDSQKQLPHYRSKSLPWSKVSLKPLDNYTTTTTTTTTPSFQRILDHRSKHWRNANRRKLSQLGVSDKNPSFVFKPLDTTTIPYFQHLRRSKLPSSVKKKYKTRPKYTEEDVQGDRPVSSDERSSLDDKQIVDLFFD